MRVGDRYRILRKSGHFLVIRIFQDVGMESKNTISCPGCSQRLRVSARVVSDGAEYWFFLCSECQDVVWQDSPDGEWVLGGYRSKALPKIVVALQQMAIETWRKRSTSREPVGG